MEGFFQNRGGITFDFSFPFAILAKAHIQKDKADIMKYVLVSGGVSPHEAFAKRTVLMI